MYWTAARMSCIHLMITRAGSMQRLWCIIYDISLFVFPIWERVSKLVNLILCTDLCLKLSLESCIIYLFMILQFRAKLGYGERGLQVLICSWHWIDDSSVSEGRPHTSLQTAMPMWQPNIFCMPLDGFYLLHPMYFRVFHSLDEELAKDNDGKCADLTFEVVLLFKHAA